MNRHFTLSRLDAALLTGNLLGLGGCLALMATQGVNVWLVLIAIGTGLSSLTKLVRGYLRPSEMALNTTAAAEL